eukprot:gnl/TRDRNA2_/TRDRNA2_84594_c0_seq1.p1 gnl/TRDRNA2_/TRDRNA2_84594_c0~~gnl/TRDRNA2_/TRDRNA2_84594_c0_seq1.p1  ORF type:complete len:286 (+),score=35.96 gnl/TRDRNA2_/TRDRNA2_84594_c0_seq1:100-957(+)
MRASRLQLIYAVSAGFICTLECARIKRGSGSALASATTSWGPTAQDWPLGPAHWASIYQGFAPAQVVDLCGGWLGNTTWNDVSRPCAEWAVKTTKCYQACFQTNRNAGFGRCMDGCAGKPNEHWCNEPADVKKDIKNTCAEMNLRWRMCRVSEHMWETPEQWFEAIDKCVFVCKTSLETQRSLGLQFGLSWRKTKCQPEIFYCDFETEECVHAKAQGDLDPQNAHCAPPVGSSGAHKCFFDDPGCGSGCKRPQPATLPIPFPAPAPAPAIAPAIDFLARSRKPQI